jgi:hypothetical protein
MSGLAEAPMLQISGAGIPGAEAAAAATEGQEERAAQGDPRARGHGCHVSLPHHIRHLQRLLLALLPYIYAIGPRPNQALCCNAHC